MTCREGDEDWEDSARCAADVLRTLAAEGLAREDDVRAVHVERVADTYPIYALGYHGELRRALGELSRWSNLLVAGRCGRFWYNNMDHSIGHGLAVARGIADGRPLSRVEISDREFWARGRAA